MVCENTNHHTRLKPHVDRLSVVDRKLFIGSVSPGRRTRDKKPARKLHVVMEQEVANTEETPNPDVPNSNMTGRFTSLNSTTFYFFTNIWQLKKRLTQH